MIDAILVIQNILALMVWALWAKSHRLERRIDDNQIKHHVLKRRFEAILDPPPRNARFE